VFSIDLRTKSSVYVIHHEVVGFYNRDAECLQRGTSWVLMWNRLPFVFKRLIKSQFTPYDNSDVSTMPCMLTGGEARWTMTKWLQMPQGSDVFCNKISVGLRIVHLCYIPQPFYTVYVYLPFVYMYILPIPVAARSKAWVFGRSLAGVVSSNPVGSMDVSVSCECCVLLGSSLCVGLITRPEEPYRLWCAWVWSWSLDNEEAVERKIRLQL
jgi:hypothetical protein